MKTFEIVNAQQIIQKIVAADIPFSAAIKMKRNIKEIDEVLTLFEEKRKALFEKYGTEIIEEGQDPQVKIEEENVEAYNADMQEILMSDVELDIKSIKAEEVEKCEATISTAELLAVSWLFEE